MSDEPTAERLRKSPSHYARPAAAEWCDDIMCDHCRIGKLERSAASSTDPAPRDDGMPRWLDSLWDAFWVVRNECDGDEDDITLGHLYDVANGAMEQLSQWRDEGYKLVKGDGIEHGDVLVPHTYVNYADGSAGPADVWRRRSAGGSQ